MSRQHAKALDESTVSALTTVGKDKGFEAGLVGEGSAAVNQPGEVQDDAGGKEVDSNNFDGSFHDDDGFDSGSELLPLQIQFTANNGKEKQVSKKDQAANLGALGKYTMDDESDIDFDESLEAISSPVGDEAFKSPQRSGRGAPKGRTETVRTHSLNIAYRHDGK